MRSRDMSVWRLGWRVSQHEPRSFWSGYLLFVMFFTFPVLSGWLLGRGFNALSTGHNSQVYWIAGALVAVRGRPDEHHPPRRVDVDTGVGAHAVAAARQPADRTGRERRTRGRPTGRLSGRGDHPLPRRRRGRDDVHRRLRRHLRRRRVHGARRTGARQRRQSRGPGAADPAGRCRDGHAHARRPHQALPSRRPTSPLRPSAVCSAT